jgi:hypothetical protein
VHGSVNDDDVETSNVTTNSQLTTRERANEVIRSGHISLDPKLVIFTVIGTYEPQVVRLFSNISCSCPAKSNCYHVLAASMAFGMHCEEPKKPFNLTQLRWNKSKHLDKTSGRKHPRIDDVDVVVLRQNSSAKSHCTSHSHQFLPSLLLTVKMMDCLTISPPTIDTNICYACNQEEPPAIGRPAVSRSSSGWAAINVDIGTTPTALNKIHSKTFCMRFLLLINSKKTTYLNSVK